MTLGGLEPWAPQILIGFREELEEFVDAMIALSLSMYWNGFEKIGMGSEVRPKLSGGVAPLYTRTLLLGAGSCSMTTKL